MPFSEVNSLRKAGNLEDAFAMAQADLIAEPENIWNKRGLSWIYFDQIKAANQSEDFEAFEQILSAITELQLPAEETMFWDQLCWQLGKMAFAAQQANHTDLARLDRLFQYIAGLPLANPGEAYSFLLKAFQKGNKVWSQYAAFVEWWSIENLRPEDYLPEEMPDGKKSMSLAEQVIIAYARKLAEAPHDREKILAFMPVLDLVIHEHPEYQYPPYFKGKLLLAIGDRENIFSAFLPFARKKQTEFWVWELLAETFDSSDTRYAACLCRALLCRAEPQFLGKVRSKLAEWLLTNQQLAEAKTELETIAAVYETEGWRLPLDVQAHTQEAWYQQATALPDNRALYQKFQDLAEEILFGDMPEETIVVDFVLLKQNLLFFVGEGGKHGGIKYGKRLRQVRIGDLLLVRFNGAGQEGKYRVFTIKPAAEDQETDLRRDFEGAISIRNDQPFGFINDVFVEPELVKKHQLTDGQTLNGVCMLSWNKKQGKLNWKAIRIEIV